MFSRRDTLKISLALSAMGLSTAPAFAWKTGELEEKISCDILVIGSGIAGTVASLQAVEDGVNVLMIEKPQKTKEAALQMFVLVHF
jgi:heterodisulfide reductase subunit A-like polyferredoxin